jgi:hypothetical protein
VRAGYVELYFRTSQRLFVLKFPGDTDRIFRLKLPANPMRTKYRTWSDWQNPDFVAKGGEQPSHPSGGNEYQIRYKWITRTDKLDCHFGGTVAAATPQHVGKKIAA